MNFDELALQLFAHQKNHNAIYHEYISGIGKPIDISNANEIPFLPIEFFKTQEVKCGNFDPEIIFTSSGTTGLSTSKHYLKEVAVYEKAYSKIFEQFYGDIKDFCIIALLPSYTEREGSSLVYMVSDLIKRSAYPLSDFYLNDFGKLSETLEHLKAQKQRTILVGVTFALLDFAENFHIDFPELIVMETGGMKGRRKEMIREEVHEVLKRSFGVSMIHSEYGMTELLSQAYSLGDGKFVCPPWMKIIITDINDPFQQLSDGRSGIINVVDLANCYSCAFIKTADIGMKHSDGTFEVLGRVDNSDLRGCSLMYL